MTRPGRSIPRRLLHNFTCRYNGAVVFSVEQHEAMAANPYLAFSLRAGDSGWLEFAWEEDGGAVFILKKPIEVVG